LHYPILADSTILRSKACDVVTSLDTTYALAGFVSFSPMASANWFVGLAPTTLNAGGVDATDVETLVLGFSGFTAVISFTVLNPVANTPAILTAFVLNQMAPVSQTCLLKLV